MTATGQGGSAIGSASGNGISYSQTVQTINHPGNILVTSGTGGTGTGESFFELSGFGWSGLNSATPWVFDTSVYVPVLPGTTAGSYEVGTFADFTGIQGSGGQGQGFYLSSTQGVPNDWYCSYGTVPTNTDSGVAATVAWTRLSMADDGINLHWYINGVEVCAPIAYSSIASANVVLSWKAVARSATSVLLYVDYVGMYISSVR
jgi:hypothetical protein